MNRQGHREERRTADVQDDVWMLQLAKHRDFPQRSAGDSLVFDFQANSLQGNNFPGVFVTGFVHNTVRSLSQGAALLNLLVAVHSAKQVTRGQ